MTCIDFRAGKRPVIPIVRYEVGYRRDPMDMGIIRINAQYQRPSEKISMQTRSSRHDLLVSILLIYVMAHGY
jgi:hypothetical protein